MASTRLFVNLLLTLIIVVLCTVQPSLSCDKCGSTGRCCTDDEICEDSPNGERCVTKGEKQDCSDGISYCYKPTICCGVMTCCPSQAQCCGLSTCCPKGAVCCPPNTCCEAGTTCCGFSGCCPSGSTCRDGQCYRNKTGFHWYYAVAVALPLFVIAIVLARYRRARIARMQALRSGVVVTSATMMTPPPPNAQSVNPYHVGYDPPTYTDVVGQQSQPANQSGDPSHVFKDMPPTMQPPQYSDVVKQADEAGRT